MVQDSTIIGEVDVLEGVKVNGTVLINTEKSLSPPAMENALCWVEVPASRIALEVLGRPLMNAALLGAFSALNREISLPSIEKAIQRRFPGEVGRQNVEIARRAYHYCREERQ
jgi:pyruvate ferredoxin oxidoreductase gamma subunit